MGTEDISRLEKSLEGLPIFNNSTNVIATIVNHGEIGEIMGDLSITPYESWDSM